MSIVYDPLHDKRSTAIMSNEYWIYRGGGVCIMMALSVLDFVHIDRILCLLQLWDSSCNIAFKLTFLLGLIHTG